MGAAPIQSNLRGIDPDAGLAVIERVRAEESLASYIRLAWPIIEPAKTYLHGWHIDAIADYLTACTRGDVKRLIINMPPRYMKSIAVTIMWPTWIWGPLGRPGERFVFASYAQKLSTEHSVSRRTILESPWYRKHWGHLVAFTRDQNEKTHYMNTARGSMHAIPMTGATGFGGNWFIIDDPHSTEDVTSKAEREAQIRFFDESVSVRLDDKFTGVIVVVMQRLALDDLSGHLLEMGGWEHLKLPGEARQTTARVYVDGQPKDIPDTDEDGKPVEKVRMPISGGVHIRQPGELLWPLREGPEQIKERKRLLGERGWAGQYQQEPVPLGGAVFKADWLRYYKALPRLSRILFSYDGAHKKGRENDYSVFSVWGIGEDHRVYLLEVWREREELPMLKRLMAALIIYWRWTAARWNTTLSAILVEDASSGTSIIQEFREAVRIDDQVRTILLKRLGYGGPMPETLDPKVAPPILPIQVDKDKLARAEAVTPMIERGDMLLPDPEIFDAPWLGDYVKEMLSFTGVSDVHDDMVDATTQLLNHVRGLGSFNLMDFWRRTAQEADAVKRRLCKSCGKPVEPGQSYQRSGPNFVHVVCPSNHANGNGVESSGGA